MSNSENRKCVGSQDFESLLPLGQDEFDFIFFRRVLARNGRNVDILRRMAELLARKTDYQEALECDMHLADVLPNDKVVHYNLACSFSMTGQIKSAIAALTRAIELGYQDFARIECDSDLDALRNEPDFQLLVDEQGDNRC